MPFDWNQARLNDPAPSGPGDWDERERLAVEAAHAETAKQREQEGLYRECREFRAFASHRAAAARKAGDEVRATAWDEAITAIEGGQWPVGRVIASEPAITRFQSLRTKFLYAGATTRLSN